MAWLFSRSSGALALVACGFGLVAWGVTATWGLPVGAMVAGVLLLWAGARAARAL
jgi:hypothetical protein